MGSYLAASGPLSFSANLYTMLKVPGRERPLLGPLPPELWEEGARSRYRGMSEGHGAGSVQGHGQYASVDVPPGE